MFLFMQFYKLSYSFLSILGLNTFLHPVLTHFQYACEYKSCSTMQNCVSNIDEENPILQNAAGSCLYKTVLTVMVVLLKHEFHSTKTFHQNALEAVRQLREKERVIVVRM